MESAVCIAIAFVCVVIGFCFSVANDYLLRKKTDVRSRIKVESREGQHEKDRNKRLTGSKYISKKLDSLFLWESTETDEGISKILKKQLERKMNNEQK